MFNNFYLRMHLLMSYVGCVGSLMAGSCIVEVLGSAFAGVSKMLIGKKYPDNVGVFVMTEELLRRVFQENPNMNCMNDLLSSLKDLSNNSRTAKLWVTCLIHPVFTMMKNVREEHERDWPLHLAAVQHPNEGSVWFPYDLGPFAHT